QRRANPEIYTDARLHALERFKKYFRVRGFPCLLLLDENGRELERIGGYRRMSLDGSRELYSTAHIVMNRLRVAVERWEQRRAAAAERREKLAAAGYREWTSRNGSYSLFAGFVGANDQVVVLTDENNRRRRVRTQQLSILDRAWIRKKLTRSLPPAP